MLLKVRGNKGEYWIISCLPDGTYRPSAFASSCNVGHNLSLPSATSSVHPAPERTIIRQRCVTATSRVSCNGSALTCTVIFCIQNSNHRRLSVRAPVADRAQEAADVAVSGAPWLGPCARHAHLSSSPASSHSDSLRSFTSSLESHLSRVMKHGLVYRCLQRQMYSASFTSD